MKIYKKMHKWQNSLKCLSEIEFSSDFDETILKLCKLYLLIQWWEIDFYYLTLIPVNH